MFGRRNRRRNYEPIDSHPKKSHFGIFFLVVIVVAILVYFLFFASDIKLFSFFTENREGDVSTVTESTLTDIIEISDLSTIQFFYNSICDVKDDKEKVKYHVAYEGKVDVGIDLEKVNIDVDNDSKIINIKIPTATIQNVSVDIGNMDYIFEDDDYDDEKVPKEAYALCKKDLLKKAEEKKELKELAMNNAKEAIRGLIEPWVDQMEENYQINVIGAD